MKTEYDKQAEGFLNKTDSEFKAEFIKKDFHFDGDTEKRDIYKCTLKRGKREYIFEFGSSINDSGFYYTIGVQKRAIDRKLLDQPKERVLKHVLRESGHVFMNNGKSDIIHYPKAPTAYSVLACLQKYEVGTFEDFCGEFGYNEDSIKANKTYKAVLNEYNNVCALYNEKELELMSEIQ